ncbi:MAG: nucleotidyltransferase domain-containing protein [Desulfuromonadales bacterium]|nr:nucleotidyltransferase domain-containing protein [Desulfuromonadales bacterium]
MIDLTPQELEIVKTLLKVYLPYCEVRVFGSRVTMMAKPYSDLDLVAVADGRIENERMSELREAFEESDLPFRVDLLDWSRISEEFKVVIEKKFQVIQAGQLAQT